ncbi:MAG: outer membrane beta-barrel protein [Ignavibacteriales bacterium]|nr:outer membrane beta-barrel protein [Ignavibacteriales bacterium]
MKKIALFAVILMLFATSFSVAQDDFKAINKAGTKALLFHFDGLGWLGAEAFNGGIGFKYMTSNNFAIRGGLLFVMLDRTIPWNVGIPPVTGTDGSQSVFGFGVEAAGLYYISLGERLFPYVGLGANFATFSTEEKNAVPTGTDQTVQKNFTLLGYNAGSVFGVAFLAGFDFFLWEELSLGAEYQIGLEVTSYADQTITVGPLTVTNKVGSLMSVGIRSTVILTLGLHF